MKNDKQIADLMELNEQLLDKISALESRVGGEAGHLSDDQKTAATFPKKRGKFSPLQIGDYIGRFGYYERKNPDIPCLTELPL